MSPRSKLLEEYADTHTRCAVCYSEGKTFDETLELHHIAGRYKKELSNDHRNLIRLCRRCHSGYHNGGGRGLSLGHILEAKTQEDGEVDVEFLASLRGRRGLREDPTDLPEWVEDERKDQGHGWWKE